MLKLTCDKVGFNEGMIWHEAYWECRQRGPRRKGRRLQGKDRDFLQAQPQRRWLGKPAFEPFETLQELQMLLTLSLFIKKSDNVCYDCCKVWWWGHPTSSSVSTRTSVEAMLNPQLKPSLFKFLIRQQNSLKIVIIVIVIVITIILEHQSRAPPTLRTANNLILLERARHLTYFKERVLIWW